MNKSTLIIFCITFLAALWIIQPRASLAQTKSFSGVIPFITTTGSFGLFNENDGKIYIYDNNLSTCVFKGQLDELGKPVRTITETP
jgi:hypothetical protein